MVRKDWRANVVAAVVRRGRGGAVGGGVAEDDAWNVGDVGADAAELMEA